MVIRRTRNLLAPVLIGALAIVVPGLTGASAAPAGPEPTVSEAGDVPVVGARRKPRVPTSAPPAAPEPDVDRAPDAVPTAPPPAAPPPAPPPPPPAPAPPAPTTTTTEAPPVVESKVSPPPAPPPVQPIRLPPTGLAAAFAAVAGVLLSFGGFCIGAGRRTPGQPGQEAASAQRTP